MLVGLVCILQEMQIVQTLKSFANVSNSSINPTVMQGTTITLQCLLKNVLKEKKNPSFFINSFCHSSSPQSSLSRDIQI